MHPLTFQSRGSGPVALALGGRQWSVQHIDWGRRIAYVEPTALPGRTRWLGAARLLSYALCQAVLAVLAEDRPADPLSRRGREALARVRADYPWAEKETTTVVVDDRQATWWSFGGRLLNAAVASRLAARGMEVDHDSLALWTGGPQDGASLREALSAVLAEAGGARPAATVGTDGASMKFSDCVPPELLALALAARQDPSQAWVEISRRPIRIAREVLS